MSFTCFTTFMDIISHGLRWGITVGRTNKKQFWLSFVFGILPDFVAFGIPAIVMVFSIIFLGQAVPDFHTGQHITTSFDYVHTIYTITHSLVTRAVVFGALWLIFKKPILPCFARLFHILLDIPTHSLAFYATPFLWPISNYRFDGIPRHNPQILYPDILLIVIVYGIYFWRKWYRRLQK